MNRKVFQMVWYIHYRVLKKNNCQIFYVRIAWCGKYPSLPHKSGKPSALCSLCNHLAPPDLSRTLPIRMSIFLSLKCTVVFISKETLKQKKMLPACRLPLSSPSFKHFTLEAGGKLQRAGTKMDTKNWIFYFIRCQESMFLLKGTLLKTNNWPRPMWPLQIIVMNLSCFICFISPEKAFLKPHQWSNSACQWNRNPVPPSIAFRSSRFLFRFLWPSLVLVTFASSLS